jgi:hypothetical protein
LVFSVVSGDAPAVFYRTSVARPEYGQDFEQAVKLSSEPQIASEISRVD